MAKKRRSKKMSQEKAEHFVQHAFPHVKIVKKAVAAMPAPDTIARADAQLPADQTIASKYQSNHVIASGDVGVDAGDADNDYTAVNVAESDDAGNVTKTRQILVNKQGDMIMEG